MAKTFDLTPKKVKSVNTGFRKIQTEFPVPESLPILNNLRKFEPQSMSGQPLVVWDKAIGYNVYDKFGNMWLDFSSGVLVASAGHSNKQIQKAIINQTKYCLLHNYCFPSEIRAKLAEKILELTSPEFKKVFILTTGAETVEAAIKLSRTYGQKIGGPEKIGIISFSGAFHGRTLGAQMIGGIPSLKNWIVNLDKNIYQLPFPNCFRCPWGKTKYKKCDEECFNKFEECLKSQNIVPQNLAMVISETYQGGAACFLPYGFVQKLSQFCKKNQIILVFDEVQAGFGRTGKMFGFEHYEVIPDMFCCGKGITSSLPLSALVGKQEIMDVIAPGEMTSTHTGNPVCCAAALANLEFIQKKNLVKHTEKIGKILYRELKKIQEKYNDIIGIVQGKGLVYGLHIIKKGSKEPDAELAFKIVEKSIEKGLLFFAPVGFGGATVKISPPLIITKDAIKDGILALDEAIAECK